MHIVIERDIHGDLTYIGPFNSFDAAFAWASKHSARGWVVQALDVPEDME